MYLKFIKYKIFKKICIKYVMQIHVVIAIIIL